MVATRSRLAEAAERGARYLAERVSPARTVQLHSSYRVIWALALNGYEAEARVLGRSLEARLDAHGDVPDRWQNRLERHYLYPNAYLVLGAQAIGLETLSRPVYRFVRSRRDPDLEGFYSQPPWTAEGLSLDTASASVGGLAALAMDDLEVAEGAARFLARALELQPAPEREFYTGVSAQGKLVTAVAPDDRVRRVAVGRPNQAWYFLGLPIRFLADLRAATGAAAHLTLALSYLRCLRAGDGNRPFTEPSGGKAGVGAAHLYRLTGDAYCRDVALEAAESILRWQEPSGCWRWDSSPSFEAEDVDLTAEHVIWLRQIDAHLQR